MSDARPKPTPSFNPWGICLGADLTPEEVEFGRAVLAFRAKHRRIPVTCSEWLALAKGLGYRKGPPPAEEAT